MASCYYLSDLCPSAPSVPTGRRITTLPSSSSSSSSNSSSSNGNSTVTLEWDLSPAVDFYWVTVEPSASNREMVYSSPWNVTLEYNVTYNISVSAVNCNGESQPLYIRYGMQQLA